MSSNLKEDDAEQDGGCSNFNDNQKSTGAYMHDPREFIDIHGSNKIQSTAQHTDGHSIISKECLVTQCDKCCTEDNEISSSHMTDSQELSSGLKLPVQETEGLRTGVTVSHGDSDDEYESAEEGDDDYSDGEDSDDFIPTDDIVNEIENVDLNSMEQTHENSQNGDVEENEETDSESEQVEKDDPLEARRRIEESLSPEEIQERKTKGQLLKDEGNAKFRSCQYDDAIKVYTEALDICPLEFHKDRSIMFANRATCKMKQEFYEDAILDSSQALELHPHYLKAMLRRAELYEKTEKLDEALKDYQKVLEIDPSQHGARAACLKLAEQIKDRNEKMKEEMMGKLKDLGNMCLRPFGLSVNNFNLQQDAETGSYSVQFQQNPGNGT